MVKQMDVRLIILMKFVLLFLSATAEGSYRGGWDNESRIIDDASPSLSCSLNPPGLPFL